jgi:hypothetical protein
MVMEVEDMRQARQTTAPHEAVMQARERLLPIRKRFAWAVEFAQVPLGDLSPGKLLDLNLELTAFAGWAVGTVGERAKGIHLYTDEEMHQTQQEFCRILGGALDGQRVLVGSYQTTLVALKWHDGRTIVIEDIGLHDRPRPDQAVYVLGQLLKDNAARPKPDAIRVCQAPKPRGASGEECGRWFVGRPDQEFCSPACRNLYNTRATRARKQQGSPGKRRVRRKQQ